MLEYQDIMIRTVGYLNKRDPELLTTFLNHRDNIPIYYQYSQTREPGAKLSDENIIGYAKNLKVKNDMLVCDVEIHNLLKLASNFDGVIDNYLMSLHKGNYKLERFIIYDREMKRKIDRKMEERIKMMEEIQNSQENNDQMSVCMEIAGAESIPELHKEAPKAE